MRKINIKSGNIIASVAILLLLTLITTILKIRFDTYISGDTGQYYSIIFNIHKGLGSFNTFLPTLVDFAFIKGLASLSAEQLCAMDFNVPNYPVDNFYHFKFHFYAILYPISLLLYLFDTNTVVQGINNFSFLSTLFIIYLITQKKGAPIWLSLLILIAISFHPAWSWSITGQAYVDRLYLPFVIVFFYLTEHQKNSEVMLYVIASISALIVEKILIYNTIFFISFAFLFPKNKKIFLSRIIYGVISGIIFFSIVKFYLDNSYYKSTIPTNVESIKNLFSMDYFVNGFISFLAINILFLLPSLLVRRKFFILAIILMAPNLIGNIGGAEKIGFTTHYHSLYFPFLIYIFSSSILDIYNSKRIKNYLISIYIALISFSFFLISFNSKNLINYDLENTRNNYIYYFYNLYVNKPRNLINSQLSIDSLIPLTAKVSTIEQGMPFLFKHLDTHLFPLNILSADFLVVSHQINNGKNYYFGYQGYHGISHTNQVNDCLNKIIMDSSLFDTENPISLAPGMVILKKKYSN